VVLLLERCLVSWSQAMDERDGHEDLCGSGRQSVIHYVHRRTELYYSSLLCLSLPFLSPPLKRRVPESFIAQGQAVILRPKARQVVPWWLKHYTTSRVLVTRSSK
jgi:hypothetical protein